MKSAIERHERGEARVVPVVLRPCQWQLTPLKALLAMPTDGRAVIDWPNRDTAFNDVAKGIAKLATTMRQKGSQAADPAAAGAKPAPAGTSTPSLPHRVRAVPKDGVYVGVDPRELPDLAVFKDADAPWCPGMVVIPAGQFLMGSPPDEEGRNDDEGPQHRVTIGHRFGIGRYAVTFAEYDRFCEETIREKPVDLGWGRSRQPVIYVSWQDAEAYIAWLRQNTGQPYRLPSEAEWECACRAGTTTPFSFGATIGTDQANYDGNYTYGNGPKGLYREKTVGVGSLPANAWGLHEMHGNVWEWVEDIWHDSYSGAPLDGTAWRHHDGPYLLGKHVVRGGSWKNSPGYCRSAFRMRYDAYDGPNNVGFRVAGRCIRT